MAPVTARVSAEGLPVVDSASGSVDARSASAACGSLESVRAGSTDLALGTKKEKKDDRVGVMLYFVVALRLGQICYIH